MYGWYSDNSVFLEDPGVYLRPGVYSVVVLEESLVLVLDLGHQVLVLFLILESQVLDNNTALLGLDVMMLCYNSQLLFPHCHTLYTDVDQALTSLQLGTVYYMASLTAFHCFTRSLALLTGSM